MRNVSVSERVRACVCVCVSVCAVNWDRDGKTEIHENNKRRSEREVKRQKNRERRRIVWVYIRFSWEERSLGGYWVQVKCALVPRDPVWQGDTRTHTRTCSLVLSLKAERGSERLSAAKRRERETPKCSPSLSLSLLFPSCLIFLCFRVKTEKGGNRSTGVKDEGEREWEKWGKRGERSEKKKAGCLRRILTTT